MRDNYALLNNKDNGEYDRRGSRAEKMIGTDHMVTKGPNKDNLERTIIIFMSAFMGFTLLVLRSMKRVKEMSHKYTYVNYLLPYLEILKYYQKNPWRTMREVHESTAAAVLGYLIPDA